MTDTQVLQAQLPLTVCYQPPTLQPPYSSSNKDLEDFVGKFYCPHALADQRIRTTEKTLEFSSTVLSTLSPYRN